MTAVMERDEMAAAYAAAVERKQVRRNVYRSYTEAERRQAWLENRTLVSGSLYEPEFRPPQTAPEFFDDRIIERNRHLFGFPETPLLLEVAVAARDGADAAVRAVKAAKKLDPRVQWVVYQNLVLWKRGDEPVMTGAERIINAVLGEWSRLHLQEADPDGE